MGREKEVRHIVIPHGKGQTICLELQRGQVNIIKYNIRKVLRKRHGGFIVKHQ